MSDERSTPPQRGDEEEEEETVVGEHEPVPPSGETPTASVSSAPALQPRDAQGETS
jgi:hypothetical protein